MGGIGFALRSKVKLAVPGLYFEESAHGLKQSIVAAGFLCARVGPPNMIHRTKAGMNIDHRNETVLYLKKRIVNESIQCSGFGFQGLAAKVRKPVA